MQYSVIDMCHVALFGVWSGNLLNVESERENVQENDHENVQENDHTIIIHAIIPLLNFVA